ncbi:25486_t:CDS:2 [Racocetra persica]|uniref:25486_t:CDS:1 n=1 Tax=Racocetra persica TaxID=160502 RepID=A0ACA9PLI9_9GLOM|nr:25486_t:CDS:2 [Racocetra persica]
MLEEEMKKEQRKFTKKLDISKKNLEGHLNLNDFVNLEELDCSFNRLDRLDFEGCSNLKKINCSNNIVLSEIKLPFDGKKLEKINLENNNLSEQGLSCFENFTRLKKLNIGNYEFGVQVPKKPATENEKGWKARKTIAKVMAWAREEKIEEDKYNRFHGSLKPLKKLTELESLDISSTDIDEGLEYLPKSLKSFKCFNSKRPQSKVQKIYGELFIYGGKIKNWQEANPEKMNNVWGEN